jgi:hypothetical protein
MTSRIPPRYVPTLTEVVSSGAQVSLGSTPAVSEEEWVQRIMRRVDLTLERRLREAVAAVVLEQTRELGPVLRVEIEAVVRATVAEAFAQELAPDTRPGGL